MNGLTTFQTALSNYLNPRARISAYLPEDRGILLDIYIRGVCLTSHNDHPATKSWHLEARFLEPKVKKIFILLPHLLLESLFGSYSLQNMTDPSNTPTSTGGRPSSILAESTQAPPLSSTDLTSVPQFSFGRLSQAHIDSAKSRLSTHQRPKSVLTEARTPKRSSTIHQSSQQSRFPPLQTLIRRDPAEGKFEAQVVRINALESGFDVLTERYEKASGLVEKYEALFKTVKKEYPDKLRISEDNDKLVLDKLVDSCIAQIMGRTNV